MDSPLCIWSAGVVSLPLGTPVELQVNGNIDAVVIRPATQGF
jgi:hypothetical protein